MEVSTFISNVGFPIACCVYMGVYLQSTLKTMTTTIENNTAAIKELREELKEVRTSSEKGE